jgi:hypothetical protein
MNILFDFEKSSLYFDNPVSIIDGSFFKDVAQDFEKIEVKLFLVILPPGVNFITTKKTGLKM